MNHPEGYLLSTTLQEDFPGRVFHIYQAFPYKPKQLKKELKKLDWKKANYTRRNFDVPMEKLRKVVGIPMGGLSYLIFTRLANGERVVMTAGRLR